MHKFKYALHWFETNPFDGKMTQHWMNFTSLKKAEAQAKIHTKGIIDSIKNLPWHPLNKQETISSQ